VPQSAPPHPQREFLSGVQWLRLAAVTRDQPPRTTVFNYFRKWRLDGAWDRIHTALRHTLRVQLGGDAQPNAGMIASQSMKTTGVGGERGYDSGQLGKKVKGRKTPPAAGYGRVRARRQRPSRQ
jgi:putative transposase